MDRLEILELQKETKRWRRKRAPPAEEKMCVGVQEAGRKVGRTERREVRELRGESEPRDESCCSLQRCTERC